MARGTKLCQKCGESNGPRSFKCKACQNPFEFKTDSPSLSKMRTKRNSEGVVKECNWKELVRGDRIKVIQGSGPYFPVANADPINMGYAGKFTVLFIAKDSIHAIGNKKESGHCVIYMGEPTFIEETGVQREPHKITKLKQRKIES